MHMGAAAIIGSEVPINFKHVVLNNASHESVGGMPTTGEVTDLCGVARACGYKYVYSAATTEELDWAIKEIVAIPELCFLEVKCALNSRKDLGRPTTTPIENKEAFMKGLQ